jgi:hypothetical protein
MATVVMALCKITSFGVNPINTYLRASLITVGHVRLYNFKKTLRYVTSIRVGPKKSILMFYDDPFGTDETVVGGNIGDY